MDDLLISGSIILAIVLLWLLLNSEGFRGRGHGFRWHGGYRGPRFIGGGYTPWYGGWGYNPYLTEPTTLILNESDSDSDSDSSKLTKEQWEKLYLSGDLKESKKEKASKESGKEGLHSGLVKQYVKTGPYGFGENGIPYGY